MQYNKSSCPQFVAVVSLMNLFTSAVVSDAAARQSPMEAVRRSIRKFEDNRYAVMKQRNIIGQVCHTPKSYDNVMHVGLRKVTFKWQRGNKIGAYWPTIGRVVVVAQVQAVTTCLFVLDGDR